ncbi:MAG TPA: hypothetical protein VE863_07120 [Pyrinomonadaceae bacterium]|jgi:O-antigen/teichoic acid export membrane protein|nr:hypothetical protein [Pyrinomonadaceae bacterium]
MAVIGYLAALGAFVCLIVVLIKQFQYGGLIHGIFGVITVGIWAFVWGWINSRRLNLRVLMIMWTVFWILFVALNLGKLSTAVAIHNS